jgi:L-type amino acid transporter 9
MIGSGIFISNKSVLEATGSIGVCLILWMICGLSALFGALSYAELGMRVPESGGEISYIFNGFKFVNLHLARILSFLFSW